MEKTDIKPEILPGGTRVYTNAHHKVGTDALLLAPFCEARPEWSAVDLGAGSGILLLLLIDGGLQGPAVGVELDRTGVALMDRAAAENGFSNLVSVAGDLREYRTRVLVDLVIANPPYYNAGLLPRDGQRARARHDGDCTIEELCLAAQRLLKDRGRFCLCFPPGRLAELFSALRENRLEPKRLRLVRKGPDAEPWLCLVDARKAGGVGLKILPDRILAPEEALSY